MPSSVSALTNFSEVARFQHPFHPIRRTDLDTFEFAKGLARVLDRKSELGLMEIVESRQESLRRVSDPHRPFRALMHLVIDAVRPEFVPRYMPNGPVTVRVAARILSDIASHTHVTPQGVPVVLDRDMHRFVFVCIFQYFLQLLTIDRYKERTEERNDAADAEAAVEMPLVEFTHDGVTFNATAHRRWSAVIGQPGHFQAISDYLRNVSPEEYGVWYFRIMQAVVGLDHNPAEGELRLLLGELRRPRVMN